MAGQCRVEFTRDGLNFFEPSAVQHQRERSKHFLDRGVVVGVGERDRRAGLESAAPIGALRRRLNATNFSPSKLVWDTRAVELAGSFTSFFSCATTRA